MNECSHAQEGQPKKWECLASSELRCIASSELGMQNECRILVEKHDPVDIPVK